MSVVVVGVLFVWAARKDGGEDRVLRNRFGTRRGTPPRPLATRQLLERFDANELADPGPRHAALESRR